MEANENEPINREISLQLADCGLKGGCKSLNPQANSARTTGTPPAGTKPINTETIFAFLAGAGVVIVAYYIRGK